MLERIKNYLDDFQKRGYRSDVENEMYDILTEYNKSGFALSLADFIALRKQAIENIKERTKNYRMMVLVLIGIMVMLECAREMRG